MGQEMTDKAHDLWQKAEYDNLTLRQTNAKLATSLLMATECLEATKVLFDLEGLQACKVSIDTVLFKIRTLCEEIKQ